MAQFLSSSFQRAPVEVSLWLLVISYVVRRRFFFCTIFSARTIINDGHVIGKYRFLRDKAREIISALWLDETILVYPWPKRSCILVSIHTYVYWLVRAICRLFANMVTSRIPSLVSIRILIGATKLSNFRPCHREPRWYTTLEFNVRLPRRYSASIITSSNNASSRFNTLAIDRGGFSILTWQYVYSKNIEARGICIYMALIIILNQEICVYRDKVHLD